jgi:hypothetical protein
MKPAVFALLLGLAGPMLVSSPAWAQSADETNCVGDDPQTKLAACTAVIESGQEEAVNQAVAFDNRSIAYRRLGQLDKAIDDASKAIGHRLLRRQALRPGHRRLHQGDRAEARLRGGL